MKRGLLFVCTFLATGTTAAEVGFRSFDDPDVVKWSEEAVELPVFPKDESLREFHVSETTTHRFFIGENTLSVGKDGVVRYALVIKTSGGATNISFEGIRCETLEYKTYASGRVDGKWMPARRSEWQPIENKPINRHHAALSRDYFCPSRLIIRTPEEGRDALRRGRHPDAS